jgi:hypothetical protein
MFDYLSPREGLRAGDWLPPSRFPAKFMCQGLRARSFFFPQVFWVVKKVNFCNFLVPKNPTSAVDISRQILRLTFQLSIVLASTNYKDEDCSGRFHTVLIS